MHARMRGLGTIVALSVLVPVTVFARVEGKKNIPALLPAPRISIARALTIARTDASLHGPLAVRGGYISSVEYGRFMKLSSGAKVAKAGPKTLVWAITYSDPTTHTKARQVIDATSGRVLARIYYAPGLP